MKIRFRKLHPDAVTPSRSHPTDAGFDLVSISESRSRGMYLYGTGLAVEIPEGHFGAIFQRSSVKDTCLSLSNAVGVIDSGYRGEIRFVFRRNWTDEADPYKVGDRIGQLVILPLPAVEFEEASELSPSPRGDGGFGSTGK